MFPGFSELQIAEAGKFGPANSMDHAAFVAMDTSAGWHGDVFTFKVGSGRAGLSYGLKAATLAGIPLSVLARAEAFLMQATGRPMRGQ